MIVLRIVRGWCLVVACLQDGLPGLIGLVALPRVLDGHGLDLEADDLQRRGDRGVTHVMISLTVRHVMISMTV